MSVKKPSVASSAKPSTPGKAVKATEGKGKEGKDSKGKGGKAGKEKAGKGKSAAKATPRRTSSSGSGAAGAAGAATAGHSHHADEGEFMDQEGLDLQVREKNLSYFACICIVYTCLLCSAHGVFGWCENVKSWWVDRQGGWMLTTTLLVLPSFRCFSV
jgi:hypothetical protein